MHAGVSWPLMKCSDYLNYLSDFRDGTLTDRKAQRRLQLHLRHCPRCRRHCDALDEGLDALRELTSVNPSVDFRDGLRQRLAAEVSLGDPVRPTNAGLAAAFLLAAAIGLFVYEGVAQREGALAVAAEPPVEPVTPTGLPIDSAPVPIETVDLTLPAFGHAPLEFHSAHAPLGGFAALGR